MIWLEEVKIYGNSPRKLFNRINPNTAIKVIVDPRKAEGPRRVLNSLWSFSKIEYVKEENFEGISQNEGRIKTTKRTELNQFKGILKFAEGSNTENKLVIIFN